MRLGQLLQTVASHVDNSESTGDPMLLLPDAVTLYLSIYVPSCHLPINLSAAVIARCTSTMQALV